MKYIDADKLRSEIERRITDNTFGAKLELMDILSFLDTLEEPVSDCHDLEEAADEYVRRARETPGHEWMTRDIVDAFKAGAEWQKAKMMEGAVEGEVVKDISNKLAVTAKNINLDGSRFGEKVKIIIVRED